MTLAAVAEQVPPAVHGLNPSERLIRMAHDIVLLHVAGAMEDGREVLAVDEPVTRTLVDGERTVFRASTSNRHARSRVVTTSNRVSNSARSSREDGGIIEVRAVFQRDTAEGRSHVRRVFRADQQLVSSTKGALVLVQTFTAAQDHLTLEVGVIKVLLLRQRSLELHLEVHVIECAEQTKHRTGSVCIVVMAVVITSSLCNRSGIRARSQIAVIERNLVRPTSIHGRINAEDVASPVSRATTALTVGQNAVDVLRDECRKRVRLLAARFHVRRVVVRRGPQVVLDAVQHRGPHAHLLDALETLVHDLGIALVEFDFLIGPSHVVHAETPRGGQRVGDLRIAPSEGVVRLILLVGRGIVEHDGVLDAATSLNQRFGGLFLEETGKDVVVLDGFVDDCIGGLQVCRTSGLHEVIELGNRRHGCPPYLRVAGRRLLPLPERI